MNKSEQSRKGLWDTIQCTKMCIMGVTKEEEKRKKGAEEIMAKIVSNLMKNINCTFKNLNKLQVG